MECKITFAQILCIFGVTSLIVQKVQADLDTAVPIDYSQRYVGYSNKGRGFAPYSINTLRTVPSYGGYGTYGYDSYNRGYGNYYNGGYRRYRGYRGYNYLNPFSALFSIFGQSLGSNFGGYRSGFGGYRPSFGGRGYGNYVGSSNFFDNNGENYGRHHHEGSLSDIGHNDEDSAGAEWENVGSDDNGNDNGSDDIGGGDDGGGDDGGGD